MRIENQLIFMSLNMTCIRICHANSLNDNIVSVHFYFHEPEALLAHQVKKKNLSISTDRWMLILGFDAPEHFRFVIPFAIIPFTESGKFHALQNAMCKSAVLVLYGRVGTFHGCKATQHNKTQQ